MLTAGGDRLRQPFAGTRLLEGGVAARPARGGDPRPGLSEPGRRFEDMARDPSQTRPLVPPLVDRVAAWSWRLLVIAGAVALLGFLLWTLKGVVIPIFLALLLSTALSPVVAWQKRRRVPGGLAVLTTLLGFFVIVIGFIMLVVGTLMSDLTDLGQAIASGTADISGWLAKNSGPLELSREEVERYMEEARRQVGLNATDALSAAAGGFSAFFGVIGGALLAIAFLVYMLGGGRDAANWVIRLFPSDHQADAARIGDRAWNTLGGYLRGVTTVAVFDSVLIGAALFILGIPYAGALTALVFLLAFIPIIGAWVSGIVVVIVALADGGLQPAIIIGLVSLGVQQLEGLVLAPLVYRHSVKLHPIVTLAAVTAGALTAGVVGAFLAVPLTALVWAIVDEALGGSASRRIVAG